MWEVAARGAASPEDAMKCEVCRAQVKELRRGRCWGCYTSWAEERPVGYGARCCICTERRREHLKTAELLGQWLPICYNCAGKTSRLQSMPQSLAGIRQALDRERRDTERRFGKKDTRVFQHDRRSGDRRTEREPDELLVIDDDMILEIEELVADDRQPADSDLTRIHDLG
jgi:hypothetical protein